VKLTAEATDTEVRSELWISFRALLQAYLAAGSLGVSGPPVLFTETSRFSLQIDGERQSMRLVFHPETGEGSWTISQAPNGSAPHGDEAGSEQGVFTLHLDAQFDWSGKPGPLAMDAVAEAIATLALS
jgi:hypothetical protein